MDVHGAGAQRSDPKRGDPRRFPRGRGPQGDAIVIYNYARCVRGRSDAKPYRVVTTGQRLCYDDSRERECPAPGGSFYGQDGNFSSNPFSYEKKAGGRVILDRVTGLMWQSSYTSAKWSARGSVAREANRKRFGGYDDWRVPTIKEIYSLIRFTGSTGMAPPGSSRAPRDAVPYLDHHLFQFDYGSPRYIDVQFITDTLYTGRVMDHQACFFGVNFADGRIKCYPTRGRSPEGSEYPIRLVRGNPAYGTNRFREMSRGVIKDEATGLTWMKYDSGQAPRSSFIRNTRRKDGSLDWEEALAYCDSLEFGGYSDWRLPDAKELQTIVDYSRSPSRTRSAAMDPLFSVTPITNQGGERDYPAFWTGTTHLDGPRHGSMGVYLSFGRAMGFFAPGGAPPGGTFRERRPPPGPPPEGAPGRRWP